MPPDRLDDAAAELRRLGFAPLAWDSVHARPWRRAADGARVDLHRSLWSASTPPARTWPVLERASTHMTIGGVAVAVPDLPLRALLVAAHAAQHRTDAEKPLEDLRRALAVADPATWEAAARLADALGLLQPLASGLALLPHGRALAARLPLVRMLDPDATGSPEAVAVGVDRIASARSLRAKAALATGLAFPPPDVLRWWSPLARRGRRGLAAAYVVRAGHLALRTGPGVLRWRRTRR